MNVFACIFWGCVVVDVLVPGVNIALGWYILWGVLGLLAADGK